ncbi:hypothetical protein L198_06769 [Cryptococcus wingfieldii CBS 7118]|uniref:Uncharacterized protein n=1 Tax=Cryptococcus wingfieldii CBS 7118 TaxID=1295528 RepID=A0A1E3IIR5_9TREE|nr:hypothetical protein L198_06769 [Cryptococcus wingfieldii CBS 7118]ODN88497.1 hypothetical protein L198_06769 [Cryptococcus wingfieldii CBS 7118]
MEGGGEYHDEEKEKAAKRLEAMVAILMARSEVEVVARKEMIKKRDKSEKTLDKMIEELVLQEKKQREEQEALSQRANPFHHFREHSFATRFADVVDSRGFDGGYDE